MRSWAVAEILAIEHGGHMPMRTLPYTALVMGQLALLPAVRAQEHEEEHLETDRDSFTPSTSVVGADRLLFESSYSFIDGRDGSETHSFPEILTRVGVNDWLELRVGWNYEIGGGGSVSGSGILSEHEGGETEEETNILYGVKVMLTEQDEWLPESSLILQGTTPTAGPETATQFTAGYVFGWTLPNEWLLDTCIRYGAANAEGDHYNQLAPSIVLKVPVHEQWNVHAEYFGSFTDNREDERNAQFFSPGVHYLISHDCEIGVRVGWGLNDDSADFFSNVGIGYRF
jgi:hypothetical protein